MCTATTARQMARAHFDVAVGLVARNGETAEIRRAAGEAMDSPCEPTIRALLDLGARRPWLVHVTSALAEAGIVAATDVLGGGNGR